MYNCHFKPIQKCKIGSGHPVWPILKWNRHQNFEIMPQNYKQVILIFYNYGRNQVDKHGQSQIFQNFHGDFILILAIDNSKEGSQIAGSPYHDLIRPYSWSIMALF